MADRLRRAALAAGIAALVGGLLPGALRAADRICERIDHEGQGYTLCAVDAGADLRIWLRDGQGRILGGFPQVDALLRAEGRQLAFAMNAGMYHPDRAPVGLFRGEGGSEGPLVTSAGPGNFGMLPNGVFCIRPDGHFAVIESRTFAADPPDCAHATQSGPMLVIDGALHPRFLPDSESRFRRNGVGVSADGSRAVFAISDGAVSFHEFARLFRDGLALPRALYFDGNVSRLHAPGLGRSDGGFPMGPIVGLAVLAGP